MTIQTIQPVSKSIDASITVPGSKSITNRALLLAALAKGTSKLSGVLFSDDSEAVLEALQNLGIKVEINRELCEVTVTGHANVFPNEKAAIYFRDAGTATRFFIPVCAAMAKGTYHFSATPRMSERPIEPLLKVLEEQGASFNFQTAYKMPFDLTAKGLKGGQVKVDIHDSSQFLSGLLMAAPLAQSNMILHSSMVLNQKTYVHMTVKMMQDFGVEVKWLDDYSLEVEQGQYQARDYQIEPDASTASYFFAMAAISNGKIHLNNMKRDCMQGDIQFLNLLENMGCQVIEEQNGISVIGTQQLKGLGDVDMSNFSDTFMTLACIAPFADSVTRIHGLAHTRLQESDRIEAISDGLSKLGVKVESTHDSLTIYPSQPHGGTVDSYKDHRIAMSLALIGLKVPGVVIERAEAVAKTCPNYFDLLKKPVV